MEHATALRRGDSENTDRLRAIIEAIGWPTRSKVGQIAEHQAWLLAQHADADREFQRRCLALMRAEPAGEVCPQHVAYLDDRLACAEGRPQRYGTQLRPSGAGVEPLPLLDGARVDEWRAGVGLEPLADYLRSAKKGVSAT